MHLTTTEMHIDGCWGKNYFFYTILPYLFYPLSRCHHYFHHYHHRDVFNLDPWGPLLHLLRPVPAAGVRGEEDCEDGRQGGQPDRGGEGLGGGGGLVSAEVSSNWFCTPVQVHCTPVLHCSNLNLVVIDCSAEVSNNWFCTPVQVYPTVGFFIILLLYYSNLTVLPNPNWSISWERSRSLTLS